MTLTKEQLKLIKLARKVVKYEENGDPIKDVVSDFQLYQMVDLLVELTQGEK